MADEPEEEPGEEDAGEEEPPDEPEEEEESVEDEEPAEDEEQAEEEEQVEDEEQAAGPFPLVSPLDGSRLAKVRATPLDQVEPLFEAARTAQVAWGKRPVVERIDAIRKVRARLLERAEEIAELVHREVGKPIEEAALAEVLPNADVVDYWCESIEEMLDGAEVDLDPISYPRKRGRTFREARGVVALITPWNYPVAIPVRTLVPALLAGNAVVWKPSEVSARSGALVASIFSESLPTGVLTILQGGPETGQALLAANVDAVVFTGSVKTGRAVAHVCAERLIPCSLELGGKDAAIVLADCKLERTARGIVWGAFTNAGQNCAGIERVYVEKGIADRFIERVVALTKELVPERDTAVMTTKAQRDIVLAHLADAKKHGAEVLAGGGSVAGGKAKGNPLALLPVVLRVEADNEGAAFMSDETFGPVLPIVVVDSEDEAIERVNASRYALTTSLWTAKVGRAEELARRLRSGVVTVNNHAFTAALPAAPWTGAGDSGFGVTNSPDALHALTRVRFLLEDRNGSAELWWYPYTPVLRTIAFAMAKLRGGAGIIGRITAFFQLLGAIPKRLFGG